MRLVGSVANRWCNVHIEDMPDLYLAALDRAPAGAFYFVENGEASFAPLLNSSRSTASLIAERLSAVTPY